jgi:hypothetical protein
VAAIEREIERILEAAGEVVDDLKTYLASPEGRRLRAYVAAALLALAPAIPRMPIVRATWVGRALGIAGGTALIIKVAQAIRDWEAQPNLTGDASGR